MTDPKSSTKMVSKVLCGSLAVSMSVAIGAYNTTKVAELLARYGHLEQQEVGSSAQVAPGF